MARSICIKRNVRKEKKSLGMDFFFRLIAVVKWSCAAGKQVFCIILLCLLFISSACSKAGTGYRKMQLSCTKGSSSSSKMFPVLQH